MEVTSHSSELVTGLWAELTGRPGNVPLPRAQLVVSGPSGQLPSDLPVEEAAVACVAVALLAAAALRDEYHRASTVRVDRAQAAVAVRSERYFQLDGRPAAAGFAPLSRFWPTADGWLRSHANYPWHKAALLEALGSSDDPDEVAPFGLFLGQSSNNESLRPEVWRPQSERQPSGAPIRRGVRWRAKHSSATRCAATPVLGDAERQVTFRCKDYGSST